jgi:Integrase core domain
MTKSTGQCLSGGPSLRHRGIHTPYAAPRANPICERLVGSLRRECLDHVLVIGVLQLSRILKEYVPHFNQARPHTCTPRHLRPGQVCVPVQVSGDRATDTGAKGFTAWGGEAGRVMAFLVLSGLHRDCCGAAT